MKKLIFSLIFIFSFSVRAFPCSSEFNNCFDVYYWDGNNFGDSLNKDLLNYLNINYRWKTTSEARNIFIGSILGWGYKEKVNVFGPGIQYPRGKHSKFLNDMNFYCLRGEETKKYIENLTGKDLSKCLLGDPGLLVSEIFPQKREKIYDVGIVCHYLDVDSPYLKNIQLSNKTYTFIDVMSPTRDFCEKINQCKFILSSAMHPLIASDSYGIPNRRIFLLKDSTLQDVIDSFNFKVGDYYSIYKGIDIPKTIDLRHEKITDKDIDIFTEEYNIPQSIIKDFCKKYKKLIKNYFQKACPLQDGIYTVSSKINKNMVLDVSGYDTLNEANVQIWEKHGGNNQKFYIKSVGNGFYTIKALHSGKMLDVAFRNKESGTNVWQYEKNNTDAQKWEIQRTEDGFFNIISACNNLYLSTNNQDLSCGTNICVKSKDCTDAQKFVFY